MASHWGVVTRRSRCWRIGRCAQRGKGRDFCWGCLPRLHPLHLVDKPCRKHGRLSAAHTTLTGLRLVLCVGRQRRAVCGTRGTLSCERASAQTTRCPSSGWSLTNTVLDHRLLFQVRRWRTRHGLQRLLRLRHGTCSSRASNSPSRGITTTRNALSAAGTGFLERDSNGLSGESSPSVTRMRMPASSS